MLPRPLRRTSPRLVADDDGLAMAGVRRWARRFAGLRKGWILLVAAGLAPVAAPADRRLASLLLAGGLIGWLACYAVLFDRIPDRVLVTGDVGVVAAIALAGPQVTSAHALVAGTSWVVVVVSIESVAIQWYTGSGAGAAAVAVLIGCYLGGCLLAIPQQFTQVLPLGLWISVEAVLARALILLVRRGAAEVDRLGERAASERERAAVDSARRSDERAAMARLHDTAAATLLMVGMGTVSSGAAWLRAQAGRDLLVLADRLQNRSADLGAALRDVAGGSGIEVAVDAPAAAVPARGALSPAEVTALADGTAEALRNVVRHSGTNRAAVSVRRDASRQTTVEVRDEGRGFTPSAEHPAKRGLRWSVQARVAAVGGRAEIRSRPGRGTVVSMVVGPAPGVATGSAGRRRSVDSSRPLLRGLCWAGLAVGAGVLLGFDLPTLARDLPDYAHPGLGIAAFVGILCAYVVAAPAVVRGRSLRWTSSLLVAIGIVASAAAIAALPVGLLGTGSVWSYNAAGLLAVAVLIDRPIASILRALAALTVCTFAQLALAEPHDLPMLAGFAEIAANALGYLVPLGAAAGRLRSVAAAADRTRRHQEEVRTAVAVAEQLHRDRARRYRELAATAGPLLSGLADGRLDPGAETVRRSCAVEAARMRRLFAETDDVGDPLLHELRACADIAARRGVPVVLATTGVVPPLGRRVRRLLTDPALAVLSCTRSRARITVTANGREVTVSVVGDRPADIPVPVQRGNGRLRRTCVCTRTSAWVDTTWDLRT